MTRPIDILHDIVLEEHDRVCKRLGMGFVVTKSYNLGGVEINYERTWAQGSTGIPIFSNEDRIAGAQILGQIMAKMGVLLIQSEDGNIVLTPGLGTLDELGRLDEVNMRLVVRSVFAGLLILREWASDLVEEMA